MSREVEEVLEALWTSSEEGRNSTSLDQLKEDAHTKVDNELIKYLRENDYVLCEGNKLGLTAKGRKEAEDIIRRHRLSERLMVDVLGMSVEETEKSACEFEHIVAPAVTESICTLLGHPNECPHGRRIPEGRCCQENRHVVESIVFSLADLKIGEKGKVSYISSKNHLSLQKLFSFGIGPGTKISVRQKHPFFIIESEQGEIALEKSVIRDIYICRVNK